VHEGLGQVSAQLTLDDVVLLGEETRGTEGAAVALEPAQRGGDVALLQGGEREMEAGEHERALRVVQRRPGLLAETVDVAVVGELVDDRFVRPAVPWVRGWYGAADAGDDQGRVDRGVVGGALPATVVEAVAVDGVEQRLRELLPGRAGLATASLGDGAETGGAGQPRVRPTSVVELPDAGIRVVASLFDGRHEGLDGASTGGVEPPGPVGGREEQEALTQRVELELGVGTVPDPDGGSRVARQGDAALGGEGVAVDRVRRPQLRTIGEHPVADERCCCIQEGLAADRGGGLAGVALVADPRIAVVVVASPLRALRQRRGGRRDHGSRGGGQPAEHGVAVVGLAGGGGRGQVGDRVVPRAGRASPGLVGGRRAVRQRIARDLEHQVAGLALGDHEVGDQLPLAETGV
jgi:hypothetical protein